MPGKGVQMSPIVRSILLVATSIAVACSSSSGGPDADISEDGGEDADRLPPQDGDVDDADVPSDGDIEGSPGDADAERDNWDGDTDGESDLCPTGWSDIFETPSEIFVDGRFTASFPECASLARFLVLPRGMTARLDLGHLPPGTFLSVATVRGAILATGYTTEGELSVEFTAPRSGEIVMTLQRPDGRDTRLIDGGLFCIDGCGRQATRYPIVLVHGMGGTDEYFGLLEYFYQVPGTLEEAGYEVYTPVTPLVGPSSMRAPILGEQIDEILAETGAAKVHLFGHSQGGLDIRVLVSGLGFADRVASTTTFATPNHGLLVELPDWLTGMNFNQDYMDGEFAATYPDIPEIPGFSWAGRSCALLDFDCHEASDGEVVIVHLSASYRLVQYAHRDDAYGGANDGLVPVSSAQWREFLGTVFADHYDEVGQIADEREGPFDHIGFYLDEAARLRALEIEEGL